MTGFDLDVVVKVVEIVGGIAVLVSLIYLGLQVKQSNLIARAECMREISDLRFATDTDQGLLGRGISNFNALTYDEKQYFHGYMIQLFNHWSMIKKMNMVDLADDDISDRWLKNMAAMLATKGLKQYWDAGGKFTLSDKDSDFLENYLAENKENIVPYNKVCSWLDIEVNDAKTTSA